MHCACSKISLIDVFSLVLVYVIQNSRRDQSPHARRKLLCTEISLQWLMETLKTLSCNCTVLEESSLVVSFWKLDSNLPYTLIWEWWSLIPNLWWAPHWIKELYLTPCTEWVNSLLLTVTDESWHTHTLFCYPASWREEALTWVTAGQEVCQPLWLELDWVIFLLNTREGCRFFQSSRRASHHHS